MYAGFSDRNALSAAVPFFFAAACAALYPCSISFAACCHSFLTVSNDSASGGPGIAGLSWARTHEAVRATIAKAVSREFMVLIDGPFGNEVRSVP